MKSGKFSSLFWTIVGGVPLAIPVGMAIFGVILTALLLAHNFSSLWIFILSSLFIIPAIVYIFKIYDHSGPGTQTEKNLFNILVIIFALGWVIFNAQFVSQNVFIDRDPGFYNVAGKWLVDHDSTDVNVEMVFGKNERLSAQEGGMWLKAGQDLSGDSQIIQPQGMHLFSAILGVAGRIAGDQALLRANVVIGGMALLAFYGFARLVIRPRWAMLATAVLGFSMPMIYFSRDTYTEPLALLFASGGLALFLTAYKKLPGVNKFLWIMSGLSAGATGLARADGFFVLIACVLFIVLALFLRRKIQKSLIQSGALFMFGALISIVVAWLDITRLTTAYYNGHGSEVRYQLLLLGIIIIFGGLAYALRKYIYKLFASSTFKKINNPLLVSSALFAGFIAIVTRPFWMREVSFLKPFTYGKYSTNHSVSVVQEKQGIPIEPRNYSETTVDWIEWYIGGALLALAIVGLILMIYRVYNKKRFEYLPILILGIMTSTLFFIYPSITADHIWADRRFLPIIIPIFIIAGFFAVSEIFDFFMSKLSKLHTVLIFLAVGLFLVIPPLKTSKPLLIRAERNQNYAAVDKFCSELPKDSAVLWLDRGTLGLAAVQTTRSYCEAEAIGYTYKKNGENNNDRYIIKKSDLKSAYQEAKKRGLTPIIVMQGDRKIEVEKNISGNLTTVATTANNILERSLLHPPTYMQIEHNSILVGYINSDGTVSPLY
ncbi:MAG TPA: hypothetical protein VFX79_02430 [Candidatus Saccharimonadales bacterium]|nr:hypothetical protein [Candidatus Saccharimonadales bacterium]